MVKSQVIESFDIKSGKKHPKLSFWHQGSCHTIPFSMSPRTDYQTRDVCRNIHRIIKSKICVQ